MEFPSDPARFIMQLHFERDFISPRTRHQLFYRPSVYYHRLAGTLPICPEPKVQTGSGEQAVTLLRPPWRFRLSVLGFSAADDLMHIHRARVLKKTATRQTARHGIL